MMEVKIPYGRGEVTAKLPEGRVRAVIEPRGAGTRAVSLEVQRETVKRALELPVGSKTLGELAEGKKTIVIVSSDHTRPVPSHITMPILLEEIREHNRDIEITILVATGLHRATTKEELIEKYGAEIVEREKILVHDCHDAAGLRRIGTLPSGGKLELNATALDANVLIAEGFIEPHFFAGFSGGRKSILPGIASYDCVVTNHCAEFIGNKHADYGILNGNPIHEDMIYAARTSGLSFILNVIIDEQKNIVEAVAGDVEAAHAKGCGMLSSMLECKAVRAPIVITSNGGYPMDRDLYQAAKSAAAAEKCCADGGVIILLSECIDGHGGEAYYNDFVGAESPETLLREIAGRGRDETRKDQWQSQILARVMIKHKLIVISSLPDQILDNMGIGHAETIEEAMKKAAEHLGDDEAPVVIIPSGIGVLIKE